MTKKIFKYPLDIIDEQTIKMPTYAKILTVQIQNDAICLWALVEDWQQPEDRKIRIIGTGHPIDEANLEYIGTIQQFVNISNGSLVWHVFEVISTRKEK